MTIPAGTRLGSYEILTPLGAGGMGEVYRARDSKLERDVAIKVLPAHLTSDPEALARFEREAKAVAALAHPNILAIFDFGRHEGVVYAVTELLEGETLREKLHAGPVSPRQAMDYALQIAKGLSAAHERGIVHRDLKPENVFVTLDGHVKILDFGLAKRLETVPGGDATNTPTVDAQTEPGKVMGTVGYMSPEQVKGLPVDHRSDIFSFGAILYELLSGERAFKRDTSAETIVAILTQEPPELTGAGRSVSPALDHIVRHCLEKEPGNRFQSAKDIAFALSEASGATTVTSGVQAVAAPAGKKKTGLFVAAGLIVLAIIAAAALLMRRAQPGPAAEAGVKRVAVLPFENLGSPENEYFADGIADEVRGKLTTIRGLQVIARASSTPYKKTAKTPRQIADELDVSYLLTATVRWEKSASASRVHVSPELVDVTQRNAPTSRWQQAFDASLTDVFQVQSDIATKVAQALGVALGAGEEKRLSEKPTENLAAYDAFLKGDEVWEMGLTDPANLRKSLVFYEQAVALDPNFAQAWARVSIANSFLYGSGTPLPDLAERARQAAEKAVTLAPGRPEGYDALGNYHRLVTVQLDISLEQQAKAHRLAPGNAEILVGIGAAESSLGRWESALEHQKQAEQLDPRSVGVMRELGLTLVLMRRYGDARGVLDRAIALAPSNLDVIEFKAMTFLGEGDLAGARAVLRAAPGTIDLTALVAFVGNYWDLAWVLDDGQRELLLRLTPGAFDGDRGVWGLTLAQAFALKEDRANMREHAEEARKAFAEQLRRAPGDAPRHVLLGLSLAYLGRKDEAIHEGLRSVELMPVSKNAFTGSYIQHQLVRIYALVGEPEKALDRLEPLMKIPYCLSPAWLKIDPNFDPLRNNPRFQKLVAAAK